MDDFVEKVRCCFERVLGSYGEGAKVRVAKIQDRWPLPIDESQAKKFPGLYRERFRGRVYVGVEIIYSEEYKKKHETKSGGHPIPIICNTVFIALGLGHITVADGEMNADCVGYPLPMTEEVYVRLPPIADVKDVW